MATRIDVSYRRTFQGAWALSTIAGGFYFERQFFGYTKREATVLFRQQVRERNAR